MGQSHQKCKEVLQEGDQQQKRGEIGDGGGGTFGHFYGERYVCQKRGVLSRGKEGGVLISTVVLKTCSLKKFAGR